MANLRERLELDVTPALQSIDRLDATLSRATQQFKGSLTDALDVLRSVQIEDVDASNVRTAIEEAVAAAASEEVAIEDVDAEPVTSGINTAVEAADTNVLVAADGTETITEGIETAVQDADATVVVEADTSDAEAAISSLGETISGSGLGQATDDVEELSSAFGESTQAAGGFGNALGSVASVATISTGNVRGLVTSVGGLTGKAGPAGAAVAGVTAATAGFFDAALQATASAERFSQVLGTLETDVRDINVGELTGDLSELTISLGSSDEAIQDSISSLVQLGQASGLSARQSATFAEQVAALSLAATGANPALGDAGQNVQALSIALGRGGPRLARYGISLSGAEIQSRALENATQGIGDGVSAAALQFAGAQLAVERYGDTLDDKVAAGQENAQIQVRSLSQQLGELIETVGTPLVSPVLDLLEALLPLAAPIAAAFGVFGQLLVGIVTPAVEALAPSLERLGDAFLEYGQILEPILDSGLMEGLAVGFEVLAFAIEALAFATETLTSLGAAATDFWGITDSAQAQAEESAKATAQAIFNENDAFQEFGVTLEGTATAIESINAALATFLTTSEDSRFVTRNQIDDLTRYGITAEDVASAVQGNTAAQRDFLAAALASNEVTIEATGSYVNAAGQTIYYRKSLSQLAESLGKTEAQTLDYLLENERLLGGNKDIIESLQQERKEYQLAAKAQAQSLVLTGQITQEMYNEAIARAIATGNWGDYAFILEEVGRLQAEESEALRQSKADLEGNAQAFRAFTEAAAETELTEAQLAKLGERFGVTTEQITEWADISNAAIDDFVDAAVSNLPSVSEAFDGLDEASSPEDFFANLQARVDAARNFAQAMLIAGDNGLKNLEQLLIENGPEALIPFQEAFATGNLALLQQYDSQLGLLEDQIDEANAISQEQFRQWAIDVGLGAEAANAAFENAFDLAGTVAGEEVPVRNAVDVLGQSLTSATSGIGANAASSLGSSFSSTLGSLIPGLKAKALSIATAVKDAFDIDSPSKVFAEIGEELGAGLAVGFESSQSGVVDAAVKVIDEAYASIADAAGSVAPIPITVSAAQPQLAVASPSVVGGSTFSEFTSNAPESTVRSIPQTVQYVSVNEVQNDPRLTAQIVASRLGVGAKR